MNINIDTAKNKICFKTILFAADHAGFTLKQTLIDELNKNTKNNIENNIENSIENNNIIKIQDLGVYNNEISVDYPDFAEKLCNIIPKDNTTSINSNLNTVAGILICGSGVGISIAANRHKQIRAALCHNAKYAQLAREHNDANVLVLGGRIVTKIQAIKIMHMFLITPFSYKKNYINRIEKLNISKE